MDNLAQNSNPVIPPIPDDTGGFPTSGGFGGPPPTAPNPVVGTATPPGKSNSRVSGKVIATIFGLLLLVGGIGAGILLVNQQQVLKEKAAGGIQCAGGTCNDGFSFGSDCAAPQSSCDARNQEACASHNGIKSGGQSITCTQPAPTNPPGAPAPFCTGSSASDRGQCIFSWTYIFPGPGCQQSNGSSLGRCCAPGDSSCNPPAGGGGTGGTSGTTLQPGALCSSGFTTLGNCPTGYACSQYTYNGCASGEVKCYGRNGSDSGCIKLGTQSPADKCAGTYTGVDRGAKCESIATGIGGTAAGTPTGNACSGSCCSADTSRGFYVRVCSCTGPLTNGRCLTGCTNGGSSACIPSNFCGSMQLDVVTASNQETGINIARNGQTSNCSGPAPTAQPAQPAGTTTPGLTAQCSSVGAYDTNWAALTITELSALKPGDKVRFTVTGTTSSGSFDQARFTINGALQAPVTGKRPGSADFFQEYTIPAGVTNFTVTAQIHLPVNDTWY